MEGNANVDALNQEYVLQFEKTFSFLKGKKIAIYGIGYRTGAILYGLTDYNFVGLLDRDPENIGKEYYGLQVMSTEQAMEEADCVIIIAISCWEIIYGRIEKLSKEHGVEVYYPNGEIASNKEPDYDTEKNDKWDISFDSIIKKIDEHDVISFDIFDTLICRKVLYTETVHDIQELEYKEDGIDIPFKDLRKTVENENPNEELDKICIKLSELIFLKYGYKISAKALIEKEQNVEKRVCFLRKRVWELYEYACRKGKNVYLISDIYLSADFMEEMFSDLDVNIEKKKMLLSCEQKKSKKDGSLWEYYKEFEDVKGKRLLHIGDDELADVKMANKYGINAAPIMSIFEMVNSSVLKKFLPDVVTMWQSLSIGLVVEKLFHDPFYFNERKKIRIDEYGTLGYCAFSGTIVNFLMWILSNAKKENVEHILFMARDGYFLLDDMKELIADDEKIDVSYLKISRILIYNVALFDEENVKEYLKIPFRGSMKYLFKKRFGLAIDLETEVSLPEDYNKVYSFVKENYMEEILSTAYEHRMNYKAYWEALTQGASSHAVVDFGYSGSCQYMLQKIVEEKILGLYLCANMSEKNKYNEGIRKKTFFFDEKNPNANGTTAYKMFSVIESLYTSPQGSFYWCNEKGKDFLYEEATKNQSCFSDKEKIHQGIIEYIKDIKSIIPYKYLKNILSDGNLEIEWFFTFFYNKNISIDEKIKNTFWVDDTFRLKSDNKLLD